MSSLTFMVSQLSSLTFAFTHWPNQNVRQAPIADSTDSKRPTVSTAEMGAPLERVAKSAPGSYTAFGLKQQRVITTLITAAGFLGPLAAGVYLPVLAELEEAFHLSGAVINVSISVFMCILAFAPVFWASFADSMGRKPIYLISMSIYISANILLASLPENVVALFILRTVQAIGGASGISLGAGVVVDIIEPKRRGAVLATTSLGVLVGPVLGPLIGGLLAVSNWRWTFGFLAIVGFLIFLMIMLLLPETSRALVGNGSSHAENGLLQLYFRDHSDGSSKAPSTSLKSRISSIWELLKSPVMLLLATSGALLFASFYAVTVTLGRYLQQYHSFTVIEVGLAYLAIGSTLVVGSQLGGRVRDWHRASFMQHHPQGDWKPETTIRLQIPGVVVCIAGLVMYGWFCHYKIHAAGMIIAAGLVGLGLSWVNILTTSYLSEIAKTKMATTVALVNMFRNLAAAISSGVIEPLITAMGVGPCYSGLAGTLTICLCIILALSTNLVGRRGAPSGVDHKG